MTSLVVQWLRLHDSSAGEAGLNPCQETNIPQGAWQGQKIKINKNNNKNNKIFLRMISKCKNKIISDRSYISVMKATRQGKMLRSSWRLLRGGDIDETSRSHWWEGANLWQSGERTSKQMHCKVMRVRRNQSGVFKK